MLNVSKIKNLLKGKKITIDELALQVGYTRSGLNKSLNSGDLKVSTLEKIAKVLDVPVSSFFSDFFDDLEVFFRQAEEVLISETLLMHRLNTKNTLISELYFKKIISTYLSKKYSPFLFLNESAEENALGLGNGLIRFVISNKNVYLKDNFFKLFFDRYEREYKTKDIEFAFYDYIIDLDEGIPEFIYVFLEFSEKHIMNLPMKVSPFEYIKHLNEQFVSYIYETEFIKWLIYNKFIDLATLTIILSQIFEISNPLFRQ